MQDITQTPETLNTKIRRQLKAARKRLNLTLEEAAQKTGLHYSYISKVENGQNEMTVSTLEALAKGYGFSVEVKIRRKQRIKEFQHSASGYLKAKKWLEEIGEWDRVSTSGFSTDGWSIVSEANAILNRMNKN
jgi:transcriptional regulator with XRE-family HTH domain